MRTSIEATSKAQEIGYPVALKIASPSILHKTEKGGVALNIKSATALRKAMKTMDAEAYLLQEMAPGGIEVIVGGKRDREFGPVILFGLGGIFVEVFKDTTIRVAPIDIGTAREMIDGIKGSALLKEFRGSNPCDTDTLTHVLVNISNLLMDHPEITSLDINPLIVLEKGKGCIAVDVKIKVEDKK